MMRAMFFETGITTYAVATSATRANGGVDLAPLSLTACNSDEDVVQHIYQLAM